MSLPVVWLPEALSELRNAIAWYRNVRPSLGERFALEIDTAVEAIRSSPLKFPAMHRNIRRAGIRRFPYGLFFELQEKRILVLACFHAKRDPQQWQSR